MTKLRLREVGWLVQDNKVVRGKKASLNLILPSPEAITPVLLHADTHPKFKNSPENWANQETLILFLTKASFLLGFLKEPLALSVLLIKWVLFLDQNFCNLGHESDFKVQCLSVTCQQWRVLWSAEQLFHGGWIDSPVGRLSVTSSGRVSTI